MLKPMVTMPKARPIAPAGAAARTSMSRDGMIMPDRKPAKPMTVTNKAGPSPIVRDQQDQNRIDAKAHRGDLAVAARHICDKPSAQHAKRARRQISGQRQIRGRETAGR